jgi:hypothetical protein
MRPRANVLMSGGATMWPGVKLLPLEDDGLVLILSRGLTPLVGLFESGVVAPPDGEVLGVTVAVSGGLASLVGLPEFEEVIPPDGEVLRVAVSSGLAPLVGVPEVESEFDAMAPPDVPTSSTGSFLTRGLPS